MLGYTVVSPPCLSRLGFFCNMSRTLWRLSSCMLLGVAIAPVSRVPAQATKAKPGTDKVAAVAEAEFFEKRIRPLLARRCWECHGKEDEPGGELRLDSRAAMLQGGSRGPAIVPGDPAKSLLIRAVNHADTLTMPPKQKLPPAEIADLAAWVKAGALWPERGAGLQPAKGVTAAKPPNEPVTSSHASDPRNFWAFQPVGNPPLPTVKDCEWPQNPLDHFILARLEAAGMSPVPRADKSALIRRATFDLLGLPPTAEEVEAFVADESPDAFARLVEKLLASPHYGERWGRHWLDIARYGDSNGLDENLAHANAWRYRDYVIAAFNDDMRYDQFVREQIAGDLLAAGEADRAAARLTATGFLVLGAKMLAEDDPVKMQMDIIDEQVDTLGKAFLGITLGCARCHDHKYDPISIADYYGLAGIFKSTKTMESFSVVARWQERPIASPEVLPRQQAHRQQIEKQQAVIDKIVAETTQQLTDTARRQPAAYVRAAARQWWLDRMRDNATSFGAARQQEPDAQARQAKSRQALWPEKTLLVEAENYQRGNALKQTTGYGEGIGVILNAGPLPNVAEYDVSVPRAGVHQIELRYAAADSRGVRISVNGQLLRTDAAKHVTGSWYPDTQQWHVEGMASLKAGVNIVRLERDGPFPHIDKLLLVPLSGSALLPGELFSTGDDERDLAAAFIGSWLAWLEKTANDPQTLFPAWREFVSRSRKLNDPASRSSSAAELVRVIEAISRELQGAAAKAEATDKHHPRRERLKQLLVDNKGGPFAPLANIEESFAAALRSRLKQERSRLEQLKSSLPKLPEVMAVAEGQIQDLPMHLRGNHTTLGAVVPRRLPAALVGESPVSFGPKTSGRLELAQWLTRPDHPLTSRVMVNRIWLWHFGEGLVRSPDNFGRLGERPTHPELLDWLARRFVASGWSVKAMHRIIMNSATYQMSTRYDEASLAKDPEHRLWWRRPRRRLEAEAIRDALLSVGGSLDRSMGGSLLPTPNRQYVTSTANVNPAIYNTSRRSVYLPVVRSALYEVLQAFDFAEPSVLNGKRDVTVVAPQALFMLNSEIVSQTARRIASDLLARNDLDDQGRAREAFRRILSRGPTEAETQRSVTFVRAYSADGKTHGGALRAWQGLCRTLLASNEFLYIE
jgi:hypothetical protein